MSSNQRLTLSAEQRLQQTLSPLQVRYFRMLEMSDAGMEEEVRRALDENPALEVADNHDPDEAEAFHETPEEMQLADYRTEDDIPATLTLRHHGGSFGDGSYREPMAVSPENSLMESLQEQLALAGLSETDEAIGQYIIGNIDNNGYLTRDPDVMADDLAMTQGVDIDAAHVRRVLEAVRRLDPAGVGAVDLRDCLLLQLRRKERSPRIDDAIRIVRDYFDLFSKKHYDRIMAATGMSRERLRLAEETIRSLNPKPGSEISGGEDDRLRHVSPDFAVDVTPDGQLSVALLSNIPELAVEKTFAEDTPLAARTGRDAGSAGTFIRNRRDEALGFIRIVKMRADTLFRVMSAIVKLQRRFFLSGNDADLRPMILKDVSAITGDDPSVVSRATQGKYVATPWGIYPLKHFFNEKFSSDAPQTSSRAIMAALRSLIDAEDKANPLSDEALAGLLAEKGMDVARRTVAKYREQLAIPVARLRRII